MDYGCLVSINSYTADNSVPISKLPRLVQETSEDFSKRGLEACHFGHVGDGNVHTLALFSDEEELKRVKVAVHEMVERAIRLGGTCSGEHGVGLGKIEYLPMELGDGTVNFMETIKVRIHLGSADSSVLSTPTISSTPERFIPISGHRAETPLRR